MVSLVRNTISSFNGKKKNKMLGNSEVLGVKNIPFYFTKHLVIRKNNLSRQSLF